VQGTIEQAIDRASDGTIERTIDQLIDRSSE
jgi:hypothetical protein